MARLLLAMLLVGPRFASCGGSEHEARPLPAAEGTCDVDADCGADACADVRCLAGSCVEIGEEVDRDGDGDSPLACGGLDCDDADATRFGSAPETCDGEDDDCDGAVDEDARATEQTVSTSGDGLSVVVPWGEAFAITENTGAGVFLRPVDLAGRLGPSHELFRLADGGEIVDVRAAGTPEGVLVAARTDIGALRLVLARRDEDGGLLALDGPRTLPLDAQVLAFDLAAHGDDWALALDLRPFDGSEPRREARLAFGDLRADLGPLGEAPPPLALASTGDDLVVTVPGGLAFAQAGLVVPPPAGATGDRLALASGEGEAIVGFDDGFGLALSRVMRDGVGEESAPGPAADPAGVVLERVGDELAVLGPGPDGRFVGWVLEGDLERYRVAGTPLGDGSGRAPSAVRAGNAFALLGPGVVAGTLQLVLTCE